MMSSHQVSLILLKKWTVFLFRIARLCCILFRQRINLCTRKVASFEIDGESSCLHRAMVILFFPLQDKILDPYTGRFSAILLQSVVGRAAQALRSEAFPQS